MTSVYKVKTESGRSLSVGTLSPDGKHNGVTATVQLGSQELVLTPNQVIFNPKVFTVRTIKGSITTTPISENLHIATLSLLSRVSIRNNQTPGRISFYRH